MAPFKLLVIDTENKFVSTGNKYNNILSYIIVIIALYIYLYIDLYIYIVIYYIIA